MHAAQHLTFRRAVALAAIAAGALISQPAASAAQATAPSTGCTAAVPGASRVAGFGGIQRPTYRGACARMPRLAAGNLEAPYERGSHPPVKFGGSGTKVMATDPSTPLTITPIFWGGSNSAQYGFSASYINLIQQYLTDVAHDSTTSTNVFAALTQYYMTGKNGPHVHYNVAGRWTTVGHPLVVTDKIPATCTVDKGRIYHHDPIGYTTCVADRDIAHEVQTVLGRRGWTADMNHLYPIFLPKHVEICFYRGHPSYQQCSVNSSKSAAFCAYHTFADTAPTAIYATLPYPVYGSPTGYSCSTEFDAPGVQYPNRKPDADVTLSSLSHEMSEAITDPKLNTWTASDGNEAADLCSDVYGALKGPDGRKWNQTINAHHYLTQEEFSNKEFALDQGGCVQNENVPTVISLSSATGASGRSVTVHGTDFRPGKTTVSFGGTPATTAAVRNTGTLTATAPLGVGAADITVKTPNGRSVTNSQDMFFDADPTISTVSPSSGPAIGATPVTITGTNFSRYPDQLPVTFGAVQVYPQTATPTSLTVLAPPGTAGDSVQVEVRTPQGSALAEYTYTS